MGKRILAAIAGLGVVVGGGVKVLAGQADNVPTPPKPPGIHVPAPHPPVTLPRLPKVPRPISRAATKAGRERANAVIWAGCELKDSPDIELDASRLVGYSDLEVSLIVEVAEAAQDYQEVWEYCDRNV